MIAIKIKNSPIKSEMYIVENGSINWSISYYLLNTYNVPDSTVMNYNPFA